MICRPFTLCLALLGLLSLPVFAAGTADDLLALHQMRLATQKSLNAFFMYVGQEGDQRYASLIESSAQTAEARLQRLDGVNGSESRRLLGQLREQWRDYAQDLDKLTGAVRNKGYSDLQPVADLARRNQQLMDLGGQLYRSLQRKNAATVPTLTEQSREQSLLMQDIALTMPRATHRWAPASSAAASVHWTTWPAAFGQPVEAQQAPQNDEEIARALRSVAIKWHYIEKSLRNYNQNSVPFLVNKNADRIIDGLEKVAALYAARNHEPRRAASGALAEKLGDAPEVGAIAALAPIQGKELGGRLHLVDIPGGCAGRPATHRPRTARATGSATGPGYSANSTRPPGRVGAGSGTARRTSAERSPANAANPGARAAWPGRDGAPRGAGPSCRAACWTASARPGD